jgi:drug/metabolite transporter (DMT)-like permease
VLVNALAGQTLGVTCMQWALKNNPSAVVQAIIATSPIVLLPMTRIVEGEKIGLRSVVGVLVAVGGVIGLTFAR